MLRKKSHFDISGSIEIREVDIAGVACIFYIFLSGYNSRTIHDIKFKFSECLGFMEATICVKFQSAGCTGVKVDIFWISPI